MNELIRMTLVAIGLTSVSGTVASLHPSPHWAVRLWDYPRVQLAAMAGASATLYAWLFWGGTWADWTFLAACLATLAWQSRRIFPYTPLAPFEVQPARAPDGPRLRLLISNVLRENTEHQLLFDRIRQQDPDVILLLETDRMWATAMEPLDRRYPHGIRRIQDNYYGLMLFSRFPLVDPKIAYLVQGDVPSVHTGIRLPEGTVVMLHGLHPRPPEPIRNQDSAPRDAELVLVGRRIREQNAGPTIVAGDLNDVAWSATSELFLRLSGLKDPRVGRGFYASFPTGVPPLRFPLDHVFHSACFRLVRLERLGSIASDHLPMLAELSYEPDAEQEQPPPELEPGDEREAQEMLERPSAR